MRESTTSPIYKDMGENRNCSTHSVMQLLSHFHQSLAAYHWPKDIASSPCGQCCFKLGDGATGAIVFNQ